MGTSIEVGLLLFDGVEPGNGFKQVPRALVALFGQPVKPFGPMGLTWTSLKVALQPASIFQPQRKSQRTTVAERISRQRESSRP